jgi:hypothetical protein
MSMRRDCRGAYIVLRLPKLLLVCTTLIALAAIAVSGCGSSSGSKLSLPTRNAPLESIFDPGGALATQPAATLDAVKRLGATRVRVFLAWGSLAPDPTSTSAPAGLNMSLPSAYPAGVWSRYDTIVRDAAARGVGIDLTLGGPPPLWAAGAGAPDPLKHPMWKPSASAFGAFVDAVATRYDGSYTPPGASSPLPRVNFWAIWNEPNYGPQLAPQAIDDSTVEVSPLLYRNLLDAAWQALQATGHGHDTILIGELAPRGITVGNSPGNFSGMVPLRFVRALYCVDSSLHQLRGAAAAVRGCPVDPAGSQRFPAEHPALFQATGFALHPYPQGTVPPNVATPDEPDFVELPTLPRFEHVLDRLQALYGSSTRFPLYSTEFGLQTNPPERILRALSPPVAARYLNWSEYISWRDSRIRSYDQFLLTDPPNASALGGFATGLLFKDGTQKATYAAYRMPIFLPLTSFSSGQALEVWGCVRPARFAKLQTGTAQRVQLQFRRASGGSFTTLRTVTLTDPYGYFDVAQKFPGSGAVRLRWSYPSGPSIFSDALGVTLR